MDVAKENATIVGGRIGLKDNMATISASKKLTALSDVRNTVHKKNIAEHSLLKQLLETERELGTPSPHRKQTPSVKRSELEMDTLQDFTHCRCNLNDKIYEDDFLPGALEFTDADIDNLKKIWYGEGGRAVKETFAFSPLKVDRFVVDLDVLVDKPDFIEFRSDDSGIELDVELELDNMHRTFQFAL